MTYGEGDKTAFRRSGEIYRVVFLVMLVLTSVSALIVGHSNEAQAATSDTLNFQGRLLTNTGGLVPDGSYDIEFNLYNVESGGTTLWTETHTSGGGNLITVQNGYFSVYLGDATTGTPFPGTIDWDQEHWLTMNVEGDGEMTPRFKLTAVPYAFRAGAVVDSAGNAYTGDDLAQVAPSSIQALNAAVAALRINQSGTGGLLQLQGDGSDVFTVDKIGNTTAFGTLDVKGESVNVGTTTQAGSLILSDGSSNTVTLTADGVTTSYSLTLPSAAGSVGKCLKTDAVTASLLVFEDCATGSGITSLNGLGATSQTFATGTSGTDFAINSSGSTHTFNIPDASGTNRGVITNGAQTLGGLKTFSNGLTVTSGQNLTVGGEAFNDLTGTGLTLSGSSLAVSYGSIAGTAVQGNTTLSCASGTGNLSGGGTSITLGAGGTCGAISIVNNPTFSGLITGQAGLTLTNAGALSTQKGADFSTTGTSNDVNFGNGSLYRLTGSSAQTITGIAGGADGRIMTLVNAGTSTATIANNSGSSSAANRITTGTGADVSVPVGSSVSFVYDTTDSLWRVNGDVAGGSGSGLTSLNGLTPTSQTFATGTSGTDFAINSSGSTHTFNIPDASGTNRGVITNGAQTLGGLKTFSNGLTVTSGQNLTVGGEAFNDLTGTGLTLSGSSLAVSYGSIAGTAVQGNTTLTCASGTGNLSGGGTSITLGAGGTCGAISIVNNPTFTTSVTSPTFTGSGAVTLSSGGGADLTLTSSSGLTILGNTTQRRIGGLTYELNSASTTTFTITNTDGANVANLSVEGSVTASSFSGSGSGLTALNAANISTGALDDGRLSSNVALLTGAQTFSGLKTFGAGLTISSGQSLVLGLSTITSSATVGRAVSLPDAAGTICLSNTDACGFLRFASGSVQTDATANNTIDVNKTNGTGNLILLKKNTTPVFTVANSGSLQIQSTDSAAMDIRNVGGSSFFSVDTSTGTIRIGPTTADATGVLFVLDTKNNTGDPTGINGGMYYNSSSSKFRCYEGGEWLDCIGTKQIRSFVDTTSDAVATNNTTNYWDTAAENNNTHPNLTPSSTARSIYGTVNVQISSTTTQDRSVVTRVERNIGSAPTCGSGTVVGFYASTFTTNSGEIVTATVSFLDSPATTSQVFYTVCSDSNTSSGNNMTIDKIRVTLEEATNTN